MNKFYHNFNNFNVRCIIFYGSQIHTCVYVCAIFYQILLAQKKVAVYDMTECS